MSGSSGVGDAINWFSRLFGSGGAAAGAAAPGMAEAGYTLAPGLTEAAVDPSSPTFSSKGLGDALKSLGGGGAGGAAASKGTGPIMPSMGGGGGGGIGRPTAQSIAPLLQLLNQRRDALLQSATGGVGAGAPQGVRPTAGLLGF